MTITLQPQVFKADPTCRKNYMKEQFKNSNQTVAKSMTVLGCTAVGAGVITKSIKLKRCSDFINKIIPNKLTKSVKKVCSLNLITKVKNAIKSELDVTGKVLSPLMDNSKKLGKLSTVRKGALGLLFVLGASVYMATVAQGAYKSGQIDQKYKDLAA